MEILCLVIAAVFFIASRGLVLLCDRLASHGPEKRS